MRKVIKKIALFSSVLFLTLLSINSWSADGNTASTANIERYLKNIQDYTYKILTIVNDFPVYLTNLSIMAQSWLKPDDTDSTAEMQANFNTLGLIFASNVAAQDDQNLQQQLTASLLGLPDASSFANPQDKPKVLETFPAINDFTYTTLLGKPPVKKNPTVDPFTVAPFNYILNASGLNIRHPYLPPNPAGRKEDIDSFRNYLNTAMAVQSFNGYILGGLYSEVKNGNALSAAQLALVQQATKPDWFTQIASEELGKVLRQILLFQSQTYVLLTQQIQTQKQLLTAQTMTNTLLILNNQNNETTMYSKALTL